MKKNPLILGMVFVLLCLALILVFQGRAASPGKNEFVLKPLEKDRLLSIRVIEGPDSVDLVKKSGQWVVANDGFPVDSTQIQNAIKVLGSVRPDSLISVSEEPGKLAEYGFGLNKGIFIEWTLSAGEKKRLEVGGAADQDYQFVYWKWAEEPGIYRTGAQIEGFTAEADGWKSREVFPPFIYENVQSVEVDWRDSLDRRIHYRLERTSDTAVRMVEPDTARVPRQNAAAIYVQTPQFAVDEFVAPGDKNVALAGLDTLPMVHVRIGMMDGRTHEIKVGRAMGGYYYARHPRHGNAIRIAQWRLNFYRKTIREILTPPGRAH